MKMRGEWWKMPAADLETYMQSVAANQLERSDLKEIIFDLLYRVQEMQRSLSRF